ncbi:unnamed protein product [Symbiodinium natans]|uniref:Uncharacterized protein n=1 Tax=Symbiodinium natans TaxID=878477 RepID=A0A812J6Y0_9DINO|nr:unnamed protein product [Symbiodinium natans]
MDTPRLKKALMHAITVQLRAMGKRMMLEAAQVVKAELKKRLISMAFQLISELTGIGGDDNPDEDTLGGDSFSNVLTGWLPSSVDVPGTPGLPTAGSVFDNMDTMMTGPGLDGLASFSGPKLDGIDLEGLADEANKGAHMEDLGDEDNLVNSLFEANKGQLMGGAMAFGLPTGAGICTDENQEQFQQSIVKSKEYLTDIRKSDMVDVFSRAGGLACTVEDLGNDVIDFLDEIMDAAETIHIFVKLVKPLPMVGKIGKFLDKPIKNVRKQLEKQFKKIQDFIRDVLLPPTNGLCQFVSSIVNKMDYLLTGFDVGLIAAFPPVQPAEMIGQVLQVCAWMPPSVRILKPVLKVISQAVSFAGMPLGFIKTVTVWVEEWFARPLVDGFKWVSNAVNSFVGPLQKVTDFLGKKYKVCILWECWSFSIKGLLDKLSGFLEDIFDFALKPFNKLLKQIFKPIETKVKEVLPLY